MPRRFTTPIGRMVQGDCFTPQTKDQQGNLRVVKTGPNAGQPSPQFYVGVAFPKMVENPTTRQMEPNAEFNAFYNELDAEARVAWPSLFPNGGPCVLPTFAWKLVDGDGVDTTGKSNAGKEGFAGHWVLRFTSGYAPKCFHAGHYAAAEQIADPKQLRCGDYVRVGGSIKSNENPTKPGLYVNFDLVEKAGHGQEITSGPDAAAAFSAPAGQAPAGMSATPLAQPGPLPVGLAAPAPHVPGGPGPAPAPYIPAAATVAAPPAAAPYAGYMPGGPGPAPAAPAPAPAAPPPAPPPAGPVMTAAATTTYAAYIAAGWTDEVLRANGLMV